MRRSANGSRVSSAEPEAQTNNQGEKVENMFNNTIGLPSPDDLGLPGYDVAVSLPNVDDLQSESNNLFASIKSGDHEAVEKKLAEKGVVVDIVPKIGCSKLFYTKFNLANSETDNGDSPLIMAAGVDCRMVKIVLKYGGNPNHANKERHTPLSIAARRYDKEAIDVLLMAGANLRAAVVKLTSMLRFMESEEQLRGYSSVKPLTVLLSDDVYLKCRCPIKTAFDVGKDIANIKDIRDEFKTEFELLIEDANEFACTFLKHIDRMWEAREILTFPVDLIKMAIDQKKKKFISHPFSQQIINDRWYGELAHKMFYGKIAVAFKFIFSPFMIIPLFLKFCLLDACRGVPIMQSSLVKLLKLKFTPCLCFCTDVLNYLIFVASLICVCVFQQSTNKITVAEYVLYVCIVSRIFIELDLVFQQGWRRYLANIWNHVDLIVLVLLFFSALYKIGIHAGLFLESDKVIMGLHKDSNAWNEDRYEDLNKLYSIDKWANEVNHYSHFLNVSYIYSMAQFVLAIRILTFLEINRSIGPMLIALKYLLMDVIKFLGVLLCFMLGTSVTIYSMSVRLYKWSEDVDSRCSSLTESSNDYSRWKENITSHQLWQDQVNHSTYVGLLTDAHGLRRINSTELCSTKLNLEPPAFQSFAETLVSIMWSTFGLFDVGVSTFKLNDHKSFQLIFQVQLCTYLLH